MKHLVQLCFCSDFDDFPFTQRHLVVSLRVAREVYRLWFPPASRVCLHRGWGSWGPERGSGDENSCLLWLVAASARSGKSVEPEPSCESPRGNKSFLTSPLTHHTAAQNKACVSASCCVWMCTCVPGLAVSVSVGVCTQLDLCFIPLPGIMFLSYAWGLYVVWIKTLYKR